MKTLQPYLLAALLPGFLTVGRAEPTAPDAGLLMRETTKAPTLAKPAEKPEIELPALKKPMSSPGNLRVKVLAFNFSGNTRIPIAELQAQLQSYVNRELSFDELQQAAAVITQYYRDRGFVVAYAYLPEQTLQNGEVELAVLEGRLDNQHLQGNTINFLNDVRIKQPVLQNFLNTLPAGSLITEYDLNRLSLLLNQIPGVNSKLVLAPGQETGSSSLNLKVKEGPLLSGYAATDNYGLYSTGYYRFDGGLTLNDPFGLGDQLNLRAQTTDSGGAVTGWADYNFALNGYGTRLDLNFSELAYTLGRSFTPLQGNGIARTVGATLSQPLLLERDAQLNAKLYYYHRWLQDNLDASGSHRDRELNAASFTLSGSLNDSLLLQPATTQSTLTVTAGQVDFTDGQAFQLDQSSGINERGAYDKFSWVLNRNQLLWGPLSFYSNFYGQAAGKNLDSSERISLGGPYGIRAYPVGQGNGDEGWLSNFELQYGMPPLPYDLPGRLQLISFIDMGYSRTNANPQAGNVTNSQHMAGYGFGLNWLEAKGFSLRTSLAWRDSNKQPTADPTASGPMAYFQLSKLF